MKTQTGLLWVPVIAVATIAVTYLLAYLVTFSVPSFVAFLLWVVAFGFMATTGVIGQAVIMHRVAWSVDGVSMTNSEAFTAVRQRWATLARWACLNLAVGTLIRTLERQRGILGLVLRIVAIAINVAWSAVTFFVVPVILFEGLATKAAISRSQELLKVSWGEGLIGASILSVIFTVAGLVAVLLAVIFAAAHATFVAVLVILAAVIGINLLSCVVSPVFTYVLYRYATTGQTVLGFTLADMAAGFRVSKRAGR